MSDPTSFRLSSTAIRLISSIGDSLGIKKSAVIEMAVRELAKRNQIE